MASTLPPNTRILEGVVTTLAPDGAVNIAPMGPIVDADMRRLILRPFTSSTTYQNLKQHGEGVFHVTDDALLIARGAIGTPPVVSGGGDAAARPAGVVRGLVLTGACRYYEFRVASLDDSSDRTRIEVDVVHSGRLRDFFGFNRAKHAVIEAAILATRIHLTGPGFVLDEIERLQTPVDKTGGPDEHQAMNELRAYVERALKGGDDD